MPNRLNKIIVSIAGALLLFTGAGPACAQRYGSTADVLKDLRYSYAPGAKWREFEPGSYSKYRKRGTSPIAGRYDEVSTETLDTRNTAQVRLMIGLQKTGERLPWVPLALDAPFLDPGRARRLPDDTITVGDKTYRAEVYQFENIKEQRGKYTYRSVHTFWLSASVPTGVLRHHEASEERVIYPGGATGLPPPSDDELISLKESNAHMTETDVRLTVAGKTLRCYCIETEERGYGDSSGKSRVCSSPDVPGGRVKGEVYGYRQGKEEGYASEELLEFEKK